ncbi:TerB family tellurite resistance protein [Bradyrhizobium sp. AUGA SZCCT0222]|uniref:tellurite resistance TerB family protein n=1 Tax=Bradyrhizobium sp. AUGA SZCCT0222 TaxID=2807668 RepID=UPI001BACDC20|nr:TerB family tellurite resistance protein [Bradyrhizobium sp. AUGA SZCCT0222]MBR1271923.1 TerB family tellurite resistance protein [Bradyrhizobium sp. AUGA SZCCT0222]
MALRAIWRSTAAKQADDAWWKSGTHAASPHQSANSKIAQIMFRSIKTFMSFFAEDEQSNNQSRNIRCQLATAALLTRVATVHSEMSEARRKKLYAVLKSHFDLSDVATVQLIQESIEVDRTAADLYHFTRQILQFMNDESRRRIVQMMWEVVYADSRVNEYEHNIIWRAADLLGVSTRQRVELRQRIAADHAASPAV